MEREQFGSRAAVIMAMAGTAIGLGNIWRFPYMVGENGGAAFIIVYVAATLLVSLPIFLAESVIGRRSRANCRGAMEKLAPGSRWKWLGFLTVFTPLIILSYYSVVGGWSVEYLFKSLAFEFNNTLSDRIRSLFSMFISSTWEPIIMHTLFLGATAGVIIGGVKKGIERFTKITIPLLFFLILIILVYSVSLPGASKGIDYLIKPDFSKLTAEAVAAAMGQSFFSMSLGVGTILIYSSYISKKENLLASGVGTAVSDLIFALLAGFAIMPAVFASGVEPDAGPGLVFQTLPFIFNKRGAGIPWVSAVVAIVFFITILVAALTSSISMMEASVAYLVDEKKFNRKKATAVIFIATWAIGVLCSLSFGPLSGVKLLGETIFNFLDKLVSNYLMTIGGLIFTIFVGWAMDKGAVRDELLSGGASPSNRPYIGPVYFLIRYVAPIAIVVIFVTNLLI